MLLLAFFFITILHLFLRIITNVMLENKNESKTNISDLGEFGLIDHLTKNFKINQKSTVSRRSSF